MPTNACRVCGHNFYEEPLLRYENMPQAAQYLPEAKSLASDNGVDLEVCQCSACGLVQLSNDPVPYYKKVIRAAAFSEEMRDFRMTQFSRFVNDYSLEGKKVLEVGCGCGEYLSVMRRCGVDAHGLEFSEKSVKQCVNSGLKVSRGFIQNTTDKLNNAPFDAFLMLSFLEHLPGPNAILQGIGTNLADSGIGLVEVPNFDMILKKNLFSEFIGDHLFYFSKDTLSTTLSRNGFDIVDCHDVWHDYIISAVVKKREKLDLSHFHTYQKKLKNEIGEYIGRFTDKQVAIWGAGHQALAVISLINLADKIKYVVDSATFKQGKYTPATHIRIVPPDALDSDPVDAIIVMAASYSDEVASIIRHRYGNRMKVTILRDSELEVV